MIENLSNGHSVLPVLDEKFRDYVLALLRDVLPDRVAERDFLVNRLTTDFFVILTIERKVPSEHEIDNYTKGPTVDTLVIGLLHEDLRCHIAERTIWLFACFTRPKRLRETKVDKLNFAFFIIINHQNVFGFQVTMSDSE